MHRRGPPGAVKALPGAQSSAQHLAQSRGSKALWSEWKPGWKQKPSREAGTGTVIGGERASNPHHTCFIALLQVGSRRAHDESVIRQGGCVLTI